MCITIIGIPFGVQCFKLAALALFVGASLQQVGLVYTTAGKAGFITGLYVVMVPLFGLFWKRATHQGAIAGLTLGFAVWIYTLLLPAAVHTGWLSADFLELGPAGIAWLKPYALFGVTGLDPVTHGTIWSLGINVAALVLVSLNGVPGLLERRQAAIFGSPRGLVPGFGTPQLKGSATTGDLRILAERFVGAAKAKAAFGEYFAARGIEPTDSLRADDAAVEVAERLLEAGQPAPFQLSDHAGRVNVPQLRDAGAVVGGQGKRALFQIGLVDLGRIGPGSRRDRLLAERDLRPARVVHLWGLEPAADATALGAEVPLGVEDVEDVAQSLAHRRGQQAHPGGGTD